VVKENMTLIQAQQHTPQGSLVVVGTGISVA